LNGFAKLDKRRHFKSNTYESAVVPFSVSFTMMDNYQNSRAHRQASEQVARIVVGSGQIVANTCDEYLKYLQIIFNLYNTR
jgi:hypothetical protein